MARDISHRAALTPLTPLRIRTARNFVVSSEDMFLILHNAVKHQLIHFFAILTSVKARACKTTRREDNQLSDWWMSVAGFVETTFTAEDLVLLPLVHPARSDPEVNAFLIRMADDRADLQKKLRNLNEAVDELFVSAMKLCFDDICMALDKWLPSLLTYYSQQELMMPRLMTGYNSTTEAKMSKGILFHINQSTRPELYLGMLLAWIGSDSWRRVFLPSPVARIRYNGRVFQKHYGPHEKIASTLTLRKSTLHPSPMRFSMRNSRFSSRGLVNIV